MLTCGPAAPVFAQDAGRTAPLIDAPGSAETAALCTACHYAAQFAGERLDHTDWAFVMSTMASEYGMPEPDETLRQTVLTYLSTHFGPDAGG